MTKYSNINNTDVFKQDIYLKRYEKNERRQAIRNRALRVQQNLESKAKNSYQYKIKQIIDQAKQIRSLQPGHLNTRLNFSPI